MLQDIIDLINALFKRRTAPIETNELLYPLGSAEKLDLNEYYIAQKLSNTNSSEKNGNWVILDDSDAIQFNEIEDYTLVEYGESDKDILKLCLDETKKENNVNLVIFWFTVLLVIVASH